MTIKCLFETIFQAISSMLMHAYFRAFQPHNFEPESGHQSPSGSATNELLEKVQKMGFSANEIKEAYERYIWC